jgi:hypothetical protein
MHDLAQAGYAIVTPVPSCTLMFKSEIPLLFPDDARCKAVSAAMYDPFEYFVLRNKDGLLKTDFKVPLGKVSYHIPCHSRVQNVGQEDRGNAQDDRRHGEYRRALRRSRRHLGRQGGVLRAVDEDRQAGVQGHGQGRAGLRQFRLRHRRPPHPAGHGRWAIT